MPASPPEVEFKGQAFKGFMGAVQTLFGEERAGHVIQAFPAELRERWRYGGLVASGWYPVAWYREVHDAAQFTLRGEPRLARRISHEATRSDLQGVYRFVLPFASPGTIIAPPQRLLGLYLRGGRVVVRDSHETGATLSYEGCHGVNRLLWEDLMARTEAMLETAQVRVISTTTLEGGGAEPNLLWRLRWEDGSPLAEGLP